MNINKTYSISVDLDGTSLSEGFTPIAKTYSINADIAIVGAPGKGIPDGGTTNQVIVKNSDASYDTKWSTLTKALVGLSNVDNTPDASKPVSTAQAIADALRLLKSGDTMSGTLEISAGAVPLRYKNTAGAVDAGNYWRNVVTGGLRRFDSNTAAAGDFSTYTTPFYMRPDRIGVNKDPVSGIALDVNGIVQASTLKLPNGAVAGYTLTTDSAGVASWASNPSNGTRTATFTVGFANADYIVSGTNAHTRLQAAHDALPSSGGKIFVHSGLYQVAGSVSITKSNVEIEFSMGATWQATSSLANFSLGTGQPGMIHIRNTTAVQSNVRIHGGFIDTNNIADLNHMSIWGGSSDVTVVGLSNVKIYDMKFANKSNSTQADGMIRLISSSSDPGNPAVGAIENITFDNNFFQNSDQSHISFIGGQYKNVKITNNSFIEANNMNIRINQPANGTATNNNSSHLRSNRNWLIDGNYFRNTTYIRSWIYDFNKTGFRSISVTNNYFDGYYVEDPATFKPTYPLNLYAYCVDLQGGGWDVKVKDNTFWKTYKAISIGQSNNGPWFKSNPTHMNEISGNVLYKVYHVFDHDSDTMADIHDNRFFSCKEAPYSALYGRHYLTSFHDNYIYNCNTTSDGSTLTASNSAIAVGSTGQKIYNNQIFDDRKLPSPSYTNTNGDTLGAPILTTSASGSLPARTVFAAYSWKNDTGETMISPVSSISAAANTLIKVEHPYTSTYGPALGANKVIWYVGTSAGTLKAQSEETHLTWADEEGFYPLVQTTVFITEPTAGFTTTGSSPSTSNTTKTLTLAGIYEVSGGTILHPNTYEGNKFFGIEQNEIYSANPDSKRIQINNFTTRDKTFGATPICVEKLPFVISAATGATTFDVQKGLVQNLTVTGNITATVLPGHWVGQKLTRQFTMGGSGGYTYTKATNEKLAGGVFLPSGVVGSIDTLEQEWDGTFWVETKRIMGVS